MKLNELQPNEGARHNSKRVGRGEGSGKGKTCGVGQKGQKSRSGVAIKGFEGGQMPLYQRLPKRGFNNNFAKQYATISLARLQFAIDEKQIDAKKDIDEAALVAAKIIKKQKDGVKLLGNGEIKAKVTLKIAKATKSAAEAIEKAGGSLEIIEPKTKKASK
ncbi:MAG: 50S ribosomal protein L15 [Pseudomonadota bacterium]